MPFTPSTRRRVLIGSAIVLVFGAVTWAAVGLDDPSGRAAPAGPTGSATATRPSISRQPASRERLPDLEQETPDEVGVKLEVTGGQRAYVLGFRSAVRNIGAGPLTVVGARPDTDQPHMTVDQLIDRVGADERVVQGVGRMTYVVSPSHRHWHYLLFDRYELRPSDPNGGASNVIVTDRKSGFCLGDRYPVPGRLPAAPAHPVYTSECGLERPGWLHFRAGISVGFGDDYPAYLEGQSLPLDGIKDGRYVLVHRVNGDRRLRESSYANNAASVLLDLTWSNGTPHVRVLAACPGTDRCSTPSSA